MARRIWSEEDRAEIRRRWQFGFTYAEIGAYFGVTDRAISLTVRRYGIIKPDEANARVAEAQKGKPKGHLHKLRLGKSQRAKWTPERRAATSDRVKAYRATAEGHAECLRGLKTVAKNRRGFEVPDVLRDEYRFLRRGKKIPAREAAAMLGIKLTTQSTGAR